jgi:predicted phage terminase large subunit-like protein
MTKRNYREDWLAFLLAKLDPAWFVEQLLGYIFTPFHREWWQFQTDHRASLILAPRGHGKSTILTVSYSLWKLAHDRELRILIVSNTFDQAKAFLREIKQHLEGNQKLIDRFGPFLGSPWTEHEITLAGRRRRAKEATITAQGLLGPIIARHYDLILLDDVVDEENARTLAQREKTLTWYYKTLLPTLEPEGEIHILGTRYHHQDLYGHLLEREFKELHRIYRAIETTPDGPRALWEEKFPLALLQQKREQAGPVIFNSQYQNDVTAMKGAIFKPEWFRRWSELPPHLVKYQGVDLAISQRDRADYFAHVTIGVDRQENIYLIACFRGRLSFEEQFQTIKRLFEQHDQPDAPVLRVGIEANAYQEALPQRFRAETAIPVKSVFTSQDKVTRALKLQARFENGKVFFPSSGTTDLTEELLLFPEAPHDDLFDAFEIAVSLAHDSLSYRDLPSRWPEVAPS